SCGPHPQPVNPTRKREAPVLADASVVSEDQSFWATTALGWLTLIVLAVSGIVLPVTYWYIVNRPNIVVRPRFDSNLVTLEISNQGRATARDLRIHCSTLTVGRGPDAPALDSEFPEFHAKQEVAYFVGPGHEVIDNEPYLVITSHRLWLLGKLPARTAKRTFTIDLRAYTDTLVDLESPSKLVDEVQQLSRNVQDVLQLMVYRHDRRRYRVERARRWLTDAKRHIGNRLRIRKEA
ncbi:MAG: hypothetical protein OXM54_06795, partial [Acidimicrobiaceae bacterium]|nr:hypothetical protein [Acidimicrobiaceae bacterium]